MFRPLEHKLLRLGGWGGGGGGGGVGKGLDGQRSG